MATITREDLEKMAMEEVSEEHHYDLADDIESATNDLLWGVINGYDREIWKLHELKEKLQSKASHAHIDAVINLMQQPPCQKLIIE